MKYSYANAKPVNLSKIDYWLRVGQCGCHKTDYEPNLMDKRKFMAELRRYCCVTGKPEYKPFTHVLFINGYRKDSPRIEKEIESISIGKPKKGLCPDKWLDTEFFIIKFK